MFSFFLCPVISGKSLDTSRKNKDPLFFRGSLFFFASHPEAEIDTKTSGRGFSSVALRGFFYLALGCVVQKTDPDFQKTTPQNAGNNRPYEEKPVATLEKKEVLKRKEKGVLCGFFLRGGF